MSAVLPLNDDNLTPLSLIGAFLTKVPADRKEGLRHLAPLIEERRRCMEECGDDWEDRPNDFLQWIMEEEGMKGKPAYNIAMVRLSPFTHERMADHHLANTCHQLRSYPHIITGIVPAL